MQCIIYAGIFASLTDGTIISALVAFGAAGPVLAMAYLLIAHQRQERKENAEMQAAERKASLELQAIERAETRDYLKSCQEQVISIARDKGIVIKDNTEAMMGLKVEMARLIARLGETREATRELKEKINEVTPGKRIEDSRGETSA